MASWVSSEEGPDQFGPDGNIHDSVFVSQETRIDLYKPTPEVQLAGGAERTEEGLMNGRGEASLCVPLKTHLSKKPGKRIRSGFVLAAVLCWQFKVGGEDFTISDTV